MTRRRRLLLAAAAVAVVAVGLPWSRHPVVFDFPVVLHSSTGDVQVWTWDVIHTDTGLHSVVLGTEHPVRVLAVLGALLIWAALRRGSRRAALAGLAVAAAALPLGSWDGGIQGRVCYLLALLIAAAALIAQRPGLDGPARPARVPEPAP